MYVCVSLCVGDSRRVRSGEQAARKLDRLRTSQFVMSPQLPSPYVLCLFVCLLFAFFRSSFLGGGTFVLFCLLRCGRYFLFSKSYIVVDACVLIEVSDGFQVFLVACSLFRGPISAVSANH